MAYEALGDFFPTAFAIHEALRPGHVRQLFPPGAGCALQLGGGAELRNPLLLPIAAVGAAIGLAGFWRLRPAAAGRGRPGLAAAVQAAWAHAFLFFAGMNASGILAHCIATRGTALGRVGVALDVAFTGASSACLILASAAGRPKPAAWAQRAVRSAPHLWVATVLAALAGNLLAPGAKAGLNELIYLVVTFSAIGVLYVNEVAPTPRSSGAGAWVRASGYAAAAAALAALVEGPLQAASSGWLGAMQITFAGCDVAFWALGAYLAAAKGYSWAGGGGRRVKVA